MSSGKPAADEVGYGKPPKSTQFRKGQSGNPKGRPKKVAQKALSFADAPTSGYLRDEFYRNLTLREDGKPVEMPAAQAIIRSLIYSATKGNRLQQRYALEKLEALEEKHEAYRIDHYVRMSTYKKECERELDACEKRREPAPKMLPHPLDIVLNPRSCEVSIYGPEYPEDEAKYDAVAGWRDLSMAKSVLAERQGRTPEFLHEGQTHCRLLLIANILNMALPRSRRADLTMMIDITLRYMVMRTKPLIFYIEAKASKLVELADPLR